MKVLSPFVFAALFFTSCSVTKKLERSARENVLNADVLKTAHVGISVYEPATGKTWYDYQGANYFVPASNTKIPTCYAAMKYLGDSLVGLRIGVPEKEQMDKNSLIIDVTGDPTFMHKDYKQQPVMRFFESQLRDKRKEPGLLIKKDEIERWGSGWSWNDYTASYMAERSRFPAFGNVITIQLNDSTKRTYIDTFLMTGKKMLGQVFRTYPSYFDSVINKRVWSDFKNILSSKPKLKITRQIASNEFLTEVSQNVFSQTEMPYVTDNGWTGLNILLQQLNSTRQWALVIPVNGTSEYAWESEDGDVSRFKINKWKAIYSQPTDSLLRPMMHRSDNFFAEQSLLMVSNELLGFMNDEKIIDTLLKTDFKDLPQKPRWVDGSGLSRYNLFSPQDFVFILNKMKNEFGMARIKNIFATGGEGTLSNYYVSDKDFIYAKTGTLSGVVAISGFLKTKKGKQLIFSVQVNNHNGSATEVRRAVEKFVEGIREQY